MTPDELEALRRAYDDYIDVIERGSPYPECIQKSIQWREAAFKYMPAILTLASRAVPAAGDVKIDRISPPNAVPLEDVAATRFVGEKELREMFPVTDVDALISDKVKEYMLIVKQAKRAAYAECIAALKKEREAFLSEEYAYPQPIGSLSERFACDECIKAIEALAEKKP